MSECTQMADDLQHVLEQVLYLHVEQAMVGNDVPMPSDERWVAAISFSGDRQGDALMAFTDADSNTSVSYILDRLGLTDRYIPPYTVYPEILNMLAGHLITRLDAQGHALSVGTPLEALPFSPYRRPASYAMHMQTDKGFRVGFYFYMKDSLA